MCHRFFRGGRAGARRHLPTSPLADAIDAHLGRSLDEMDEVAIRAEMAVNEQLVRRLNARNANAAETLVRRQAKRNRDANPGDMHAGQKATRADHRRAPRVAPVGRTCRARLAELNAAAAEEAAARRHRQRYGRATQDPDGTLCLSAGLSGRGAETFATALEAFRITDRVAGGSRTPDQRTTDALVAMPARRSTTAPRRPRTANVRT